ncbi:MAG: butyrate kinase [Anaerovoracaceae bacterium]
MTKSKILVINPGSTSTKVGIYQEEENIFVKTIAHPMEEIDRYEEVTDQLEMRVALVKALLKESHVDKKELRAVVGRGGLLPGVKVGGYLVTEEMRETLLSGIAAAHASNLGALIAHELASPLGIPAFIYDCVTADEFDEIAKVTGMPDCTRHSVCHVLNQKAVARKIAEKYGKPYDAMRMIVAHLGGGISIGAHREGRIVDCIRDDAGPFSPERSGSVPMLDLIEMCYAGKYNKKEMVKRVRGMGGIKAYLGTTDLRKVEEMIQKGDPLAKKIYEAEAYQIAKGIGEMAPVLHCDLDCIVLTGGMAYSKVMTEMISDRVRGLGKVEILPGEDEMEALNLGALRILSGKEVAKEFHLPKEEE